MPQPLQEENKGGSDLVHLSDDIRQYLRKKTAKNCPSQQVSFFHIGQFLCKRKHGFSVSKCLVVSPVGRYLCREKSRVFSLNMFLRVARWAVPVYIESEGSSVSIRVLQRMKGSR